MVAIAKEYSMDLPGGDLEEFRHLVQITTEDEPTSTVFLSKFKTLREFYRSPEIIQRVAYEAVADAAEDQVVYLELRFTPMALARSEGYSLAEVTNWVLDATHQAARDTGIDVGLILSMNRHESVELGQQVVDLAISHCYDGVVAVDLAGAEDKFSGAPFADVFQKAREAGLNLTIHAGEWAGPPSVEEAIDVLGAARVGHGVRVIQDVNLVRRVRDQQIALEVCLTSNLQSGVVPDFDHHPIRQLYEAGVLTTLNTDDPSICAINLTDEYVTAMEKTGLSLDDVKQHIINAAEAAFLPDDARKALVNRLTKELLIDDPEAL
jgi:adenosine deaminase